MRPALGSFAALLALVWSSLASAAGAPVATATKEQVSAAQKTFKAGDELYDAGRFEAAITAYRASYEIVASPNSRLMIARALRELGRAAEAHAELDATLREAQAALASDPKYASTIAAAQTEKAALEATLGRLIVRVPSDVAITSLGVAGRQIAPDAAAAPIFVAPGSVAVVARSADGREARGEVQLTAGAEQQLTLAFPPRQAAAPAAPGPSAPAERTPSVPLRTLSYVSGGVGVAGLVAFGVFGALNNSTHAELEDDCPNDRCAGERQDDIDAGRRYQLLANVGLIVGVVGVGAGVTLFVLSSEPDPARAGIRLGVSARDVRLEGRF